MTLQNRVTPYGEIVAHHARGHCMGNRGGCFHDGARRLMPRRRWVGTAWLICRLQFKERHREVMSPGRYTELFFLDEATALAAGHRPCAECRRADFVRFAQLWAKAWGNATRDKAAKGNAANGNGAKGSVARGCDGNGRAYVREMDTRLHGERLASMAEPASRPIVEIGDVPAGAFVSVRDEPVLIGHDRRLWRWSFTGYSPLSEAEVAACSAQGGAALITPPATVGVLAAGYSPHIHASAATPGTAGHTDPMPQTAR